MYILQELLKDTYFNNLYDCDLFSSHINTCEDLDKIYEKLDKYLVVTRLKPVNFNVKLRKTRFL